MVRVSLGLRLGLRLGCRFIFLLYLLPFHQLPSILLLPSWWQNRHCLTEIRVSWNGKLALHQGCTTFCYCRPHYFYLYEVRPPMSLSYIYEIRLIFFSRTTSEVSSNVEHETTLYSHHRLID